MRKMKQQFTDSAKELRCLKTLILTALFIALGIILGQFSIQITQNVKIGISFIATQLTAALFGPVVGGIMGGVSDILKFIVKPTGAFSILWTVNAVVGPIIYGIMLYKKKWTFLRILASKTVVAVVVNILLSCTWSAILYGSAFWALLPVKALQQVIQVPIQTIIFYVFVKALQTARLFESKVVEGPSYTFQYIISFLIPLVGFILGSILLSKDNETEKELGKSCIVLGIISIVIYSVIAVFIFL